MEMEERGEGWQAAQAAAALGSAGMSCGGGREEEKEEGIWRLPGPWPRELKKLGG